jgi:hypothetical protein
MRKKKDKGEELKAKRELFCRYYTQKGAGIACVHLATASAVSQLLALTGEVFLGEGWGCRPSFTWLRWHSWPETLVANL